MLDAAAAPRCWPDTRKCCDQQSRLPHSSQVRRSPPSWAFSRAAPARRQLSRPVASERCAALLRVAWRAPGADGCCCLVAGHIGILTGFAYIFVQLAGACVGILLLVRLACWYPELHGFLRESQCFCCCSVG